MPTTNPYTTFARMRVDVQRLIAIARTEELREKLVRLIHVYDLLERKFMDQPPPLASPKPPELTTLQKRSYITGATNYMRGYPRAECEHDEYMLRGWDDRQKRYPDLHANQPAAITQESDPVKP